MKPPEERPETETVAGSTLYAESGLAAWAGIPDAESRAHAATAVRAVFIEISFQWGFAWKQSMKGALTRKAVAASYRRGYPGAGGVPPPNCSGFASSAAGVGPGICAASFNPSRFRRATDPRRR